MAQIIISFTFFLKDKLNLKFKTDQRIEIEQKNEISESSITDEPFSFKLLGTAAMGYTKVNNCKMKCLTNF